jgi:lipoyl(octanoyl) transferase
MRKINLGKINYKDAYQIQLEEVENIRSGAEEAIILCSHNPVVTLGKKSGPQDILGWQGSIEQIERGGKATYHGPGQVIIYPILDLKRHNQNLSGFLESLEQGMIEVLKLYGIHGHGNQDRGTPDYTGVWVETELGLKKMASIGIAVKRWITFHGLALNLYSDDLAFRGIQPCGFSTNTMTNLESLIAEKVDRSTFENQLSEILIQKFSLL